MNDKIKRLSVFIAGILMIAGCSGKLAKLQKNGTVQEKYAAAINYYESKDYYRAGVLFEEITPLLRGDSTAEKTQFYNAYCNYYQGLYQMSSYLFKNFYATYANSPFAEEAYYMHAYSMFRDSPKYDLDQTSTLAAIDALQTFINTFPYSEYAPKSTQNLIDLRNRLERKDYQRAKQYYETSGVTIANYKAAVIAIDNFMKDFPDSPYKEELMFIQLVSEQELAESTIFKLQNERFTKALRFYEDFVDAFPNSKYMKDAIKAYEAAQEGLEEVNELQEKIDTQKLEIKEKTAKAKEVAPTN
ncbi:MAG: outer membrane protein assembly factor BamD [Spirosomataceae bacterium]|jgi:outer membrane protein assembly factor BamD